jgi:hypothetical protein
MAWDPMAAPFVNDGHFQFPARLCSQLHQPDGTGQVSGSTADEQNVKFNGFMRGHGFPPLFKSGCPNGGRKMPLTELNVVQELSDSLIYH